MSDWTVERGIGEIRAARLSDGQIEDAFVLRAGRLQPGERVRAKLRTKDGRRGFAEAHGQSIYVDAWPAKATEGQEAELTITRAAIPERGRWKDARGRADAATGDPVAGAANGDLRAGGWEELVEEARTGRITFPGGTLVIVPTPAGTTIDIDGNLPPAELAPQGAQAAARAIRRHDLAGSILIDIPGTLDRAGRQVVAERFDAALGGSFERTSINGFGLLQVIRPRMRPSLLELCQYLPTESAALDLIRRAERAAPAVALELRAGRSVSDWIEARPQLLDDLGRRTGARIVLKAYGADPLWWGDVSQLFEVR